MSFKYIRKMPSAEELIEELPLSDELKQIKKQRDEIIRNIITKKDNRFLVVVGPCSADVEDAVCEYIVRLAKVQEKTKDKLFIIPRIYTNKPRTTGAGYKGMLHQPNPDAEPNMYEGIKAIRKLQIRAFKESYLTAADEMLYPGNLIYMQDILSYIAIGARSVENQQHRLTVSGLDVPVGMKNPTSGDISVMLNSIEAGQSGHTFLFNNWEVKTSGNPLTHAILRGSVNKHGQSLPNYHYEDLMFLAEQYEKRDVVNKFCIVDANHANSKKCFYEQPRIVKEILHSRRHSDVIKNLVGGVMIESYLVEGNQPVGSENHVYGKSITDACLGWEDTENLLYYIADNLE